MQPKQPPTPKRSGRQPRPGPDKKALARVRDEMAAAGITPSQWARDNGYSRATVIDLLLGRRSGHYGEAHRVAVALGLKAGKEVVSAKGWRPKATAGAAA